MLKRAVIFVYLCCLGHVASAQQPSPEQAKMFAVIANGYRANIESFDVMTCKYNTTFAFAKTLEDALAEKWADEPSMSSMVCYRSGNSIRYRVEEDAASKRTIENPKQKFDKFAGLKSGAFVPFTTMDSLIGKAHGLLYLPRNHTVNIYDGGSRKAKEIGPDFILNEIGVNSNYDLGLLADRSAKGEIKSLVKPTNKKGEIVVEFHLESSLTIVMTIDSARGFLPVRIVETTESKSLGKSVTTDIVPAVKECSKGRWFPMRIVRYAKQTPTQMPVPCRTYRVTELDVDKKPPEEVFALDLPAGTNILQFGNGLKRFKTRKNERVTVADMDRIHQLTEEAPKKPQVDTAIVQPKRMHWAWYAAGGGLAAVLLALLARRFLRKRGPHATT